MSRSKTNPTKSGPMTKRLRELNAWTDKEIKDFRETLNVESIAYWDGDVPVRMSEAKQIEKDKKKIGRKYKS